MLFYGVSDLPEITPDKTIKVYITTIGQALEACRPAFSPMFKGDNVRLPLLFIQHGSKLDYIKAGRICFI